MKYIFLLIICVIIALIISFRKYKFQEYCSLDKKSAPLKPIYGFSMVIIDLAFVFLKGQKNDSSKEKLYTKLRSVSLGICSFTIIIFFGLIYSFTTPASKQASKEEFSKTQSSLDISSNETDASTDATSSSALEDEKYIKIKDTISIFESYREDIESLFLDENESYMSVDKPLNLITEYGEENIIISWSFEPDNVVDNSGNIIYDNVSADGCSTFAYAQLTLNDVSATLTIPIFICPP